ncbi:alpha/beta fold hydrolase [Jatrophihabitans telluris]|uniref:Alpha/beta fold hydrolase n=1 Tax=Jatrophihabitans telluris TaxID=2038343 RepID=A0ABY4QZN2_9ACTN|nr:alpha/beta fold hydrolase [Jatrophihabitans telluris]UQX88973.1 alpha/beta fold hydrolase [Jatrophihabitans telluris]
MSIAVFRHAGAGAFRPLVLLHPLGVDHTFWAALVDDIADRDVVTLDLPGHGVSPTPASAVSLDVLARSVGSALRSAGLIEVDLVGVSLGGLIAQHLSAQDDIVVAHLVLVDTVISYPSVVRKQWRSRALTARTDGMRSLVDPTMQTWFSAGYLADPDARLSQLIEVFSTGDPEGYALNCCALAEANTVGLLATLDVPTLVACGVDDLAHFREEAERLARAVAYAQLVWLPGRHAAAFESATEFASVLKEFLMKEAAA